ncbi:anti-sigma factor [Devosia nitrariae]|uniref:Anti-sigma factor n=2 Tax=Devosia nitrariae TaxID=2071872 RepID=A0ABQ5WAB1_9HYPH|nr:anti-sigma factor [Devosia nitrariae]
MAFADGAIEEPRFSDIAAAIEADPDLARRLELLAAGGEAARAVYGPLADRPVPDRLRRRVEATIAAAETVKVVPFRRLHSRPAWQPVTIAASVAVVLAAPAGYFFARTGEDFSIAAGEPLAPSLVAQLETVPSGAEAELGAATLQPIATFTDAAQNLCREFELDREVTTVAVACRSEDSWRVAIAIDAPPADDGYAPASSLAALDAFLDSIGAGPPMSPEEERRLLLSR